MIRIMITDAVGTLLGSTTLDTDDLSQHGDVRAEWIGDKILDELPSDKDALMKLLEKQQEA